ncbi:MAG: bifunctional (p)ppGpp synthetase/guanosine-3',5'-bis(diphosphate) 3'-pyrophosphohydrolase [Hydrogenovibrio sp.]|uniref:RelA/SpoT family protein n=1 Tax=Hydrogenovibrio sp. TaxID=2065821 RepID=UPI00286FB946|nr:bifunctional (p)ppGpp synthetase/guanosine-3',5'-bis(diphosphate) 3'-pyrophosphohydrolase [Hydrogenovibrio sp.]MDR9497709.1 bifunctional (p)ppGpp synthetase/guanosine-3',5'-bis(diphosphate) 3'-pyrophosphohydrolase [Hydrogenovibrio sp.]
MSAQNIDRLYKQIFKHLDAQSPDPLAHEACDWALSAMQTPSDEFPVRSATVAGALAQLKLDRETLIATLLSDPALEERLPDTELTNRYGKTVAALVKGIRRLNQFKDLQTVAVTNEEQTERLRQMLLAMISDIRIMIVKLGYRVIRLRQLKDAPEEARYRIAQETQLIFAPLANRLGIAQLKWELEDLSFRYLMPDTYKDIARQLDARRDQRECYIESFMARLRELFADSRIECQISGRPKHIFSIWKKMTQKHLGIEELYDLRAVRIYVNSVSECYEALGIIHSRWNYIKTEFDDYIASPKDNGYQSIHTVVLGDGSKPVEIQIRTHEMHYHAEYGVAAHWRYKEGGKRLDERLEKSINLVRQMLEYNDNPDLLNEISTELLSEQIYVMTPENEVITLSQGATALDFAYQIHTNLGHSCRGAKINGKIRPLTYQLKTGDKVEILSVKNGGPNRNWLNPNLHYLGTSRARTKVRHWFNQQNKEANIEAGQALFQKECKRLNADISAHTLAERFRLSSAEALFEDLGKGQINERQLTDAIQRWLQPLRQNESKRSERPTQVEKPDWPAVGVPESGVYVVGAPQVVTHLAPCCEPEPGDEIIGYVTRGRGVTVHRQDCGNILNLTFEEQKRLLEVAWAGSKPASAGRPTLANIQLLAFDRKGLLRDVMTLLTQADINLLSSDTKTDREDGSVSMTLQVELDERIQLGELLDQLEQVQNVVSSSIDVGTDARDQSA